MGGNSYWMVFGRFSRINIYEKNEKCAKININAMNIFSTTYL